LGLVDSLVSVRTRVGLVGPVSV